jgi:5-(carboxyamino)imidazole ribonucleotide synthase
MKTIGIIGGGQLGRMLALAAYPLGARVVFLDPAPDSPMKHLARQICGAYDDEGALQELARTSDVVTYEFENVPVRAAEQIARVRDIFPPPDALRLSQDRWQEKRFFQSLEIPTPPFERVDSREDLERAIETIGLPAVLKTRRMGYDGKGQFVIRSNRDADAAWEALGGAQLILEGFVPFAREVSILAARGRAGETVFYPLAENEHRDGILRLSLAPASNADNALQKVAQENARRVLGALNYMGVLAIELFQVGEALLANEMAPRVHNSGHWTIEGAVTSQFENHVRAILGMPLGETRARGHCAIVNFIGTLPDVPALMKIRGAHVHLYDKAPRRGRKLGHVTIVAEDEETRDLRVQQVKELME